MTRFNRSWPDIRIGDIFYVRELAPAAVNNLSEVGQTERYQPLSEAFDASHFDFQLRREYVEHCAFYGREPKWTRFVSKEILSELRRHWLISEYFDPLAILLHCRERLGFSCAICDGGLIYDVCSALNIFRLHRIRQLAFLHDPPIMGADIESGLGMCFSHTRYFHSLLVMAVAGLLGRQAKLSRYFLRHLVVAALTHDVLTPAGGDSVKPLDPDAFDEDQHYAEAFRDNPKWDAVKKKHCLSERRLIEIVAGHGILGRLLDIADKTAYVAHDMGAYLASEQNLPLFGSSHGHGGVCDIRNFPYLSKRGVCQLWDCVSIENGMVVVNDANRLIDFLTLRALMFRYLYCNPLARCCEQVIVFLVVNILYQEGGITRRMLLDMDDDQLNELLSRYTCHQNFRAKVLREKITPRIEEFPSEREAKERIRTFLKRDQDLFFVLETMPRSSKQPLQYLVRSESGRIQPLEEAYPSSVEVIRSIDDDPNPTKLYIFSAEQLLRIVPEAILEKIRSYQKIQFCL